MLRAVDSLEFGPIGAAPFRAQNLKPAPVQEPLKHESVEAEISRLTWSVLDGSASLSDRQRLATLVNAQHAVRRRIDR